MINKTSYLMRRWRECIRNSTDSPYDRILFDGMFWQEEYEKVFRRKEYDGGGG